MLHIKRKKPADMAQVKRRLVYGGFKLSRRLINKDRSHVFSPFQNIKNKRLGIIEPLQLDVSRSNKAKEHLFVRRFGML
ncbi:hypothetical protein CEXT_189731 [Caerostris extrusa]|uniref:Uncharacterized protein n=1 Tax=Caerostris extrusa TaxID=172846 RepID=A0AAV4XXC1_CAEEX|nr:hypothetical protein CEXT_189731 [Caerostris extrusa]